MIQFNLLPDVKSQYIRAKKFKQLSIAVSFIVSGVSILVLLLMVLYVDVGQKTHLNDLSNDIQTNTSRISGDSNLNKILTIQNQLTSLPLLEGQTPAVTRLLTFITQLTPTTASISSLQSDFTQNTLTITGSADSLNTVNAYIDTIKSATYTLNGTTTNAFSTVVLSGFGYASSSSNGQPANYTISFDFNPAIFANNNDVNSLTVHTENVTRSLADVPTDLFVKKTTTSTSGGGQ